MGKFNIWRWKYWTRVQYFAGFKILYVNRLQCFIGEFIISQRYLEPAPVSIFAGFKLLNDTSTEKDDILVNICISSTVGHEKILLNNRTFFLFFKVKKCMNTFAKETLIMKKPRGPGAISPTWNLVQWRLLRKWTKNLPTVIHMFYVKYQAPLVVLAFEWIVISSPM